MHHLEFNCHNCQSPIALALLNQTIPQHFTCSHCNQDYTFGTKILSELKQFEALCQQIHASKDILGHASIAVDIGSHNVKIPFQLLLTRFSSILELEIGGRKTIISFRVDTLNDIQKNNDRLPSLTS